MAPTNSTIKNKINNTEVLLLISTENMRKIRKTLEIAMLIMKTTKIKSKSRTRKITTRTKDQFQNLRRKFIKKRAKNLKKIVRYQMHHNNKMVKKQMNRSNMHKKNIDNKNIKQTSH